MHTTFVLVPGEGYLSRERLFLIEKSCAGINFMIAAFGMSAWMLCQRIGSWRSGARALGLSLLASYSAAVTVNAARIAIAMWLAAHSLAPSGVSAGQFHRVEGIIVYFGGLFVFYELVQRFDRVAVLPATASFSSGCEIALRVLRVRR
jgi:exosortase K